MGQTTIANEELEAMLDRAARKGEIGRASCRERV